MELRPAATKQRVAASLHLLADAGRQHVGIMTIMIKRTRSFPFRENLSIDFNIDTSFNNSMNIIKYIIKQVDNMTMDNIKNIIVIVNNK